MEAHTIIITIITLTATLLGVFGWSHKALRQRITDMEIELAKRPSHENARLIVEDKLAPFQVSYQALTRRIDDLQRESYKLNDKIDKLLVICTEMVHKENVRK